MVSTLTLMISMILHAVRTSPMTGLFKTVTDLMLCAKTKHSFEPKMFLSTQRFQHISEFRLGLMEKEMFPNITFNAN